MRKSILAFTLLLFSFSAFAQEKSFKEYMTNHLTATDYVYHAVNFVDFYQTRQAIRNQGYEEGNPILTSVFGDDFSDGEIAASFVIGSLLYSYMSYRMWKDDVPYETQRNIKFVQIGIKGSAIIWNFSVGARF